MAGGSSDPTDALTKVIVLAVVVAVVGIGFFLRAFSEGSTEPATQTTNPPVSHPPTTPDSVLPDGVGGYSPQLSPDGTTIAFLRDPRDRHIRNGAPFVLQLWLINVDGSGLRKVGQQPGCCIVLRGHLHWSEDGSSIVFGGAHAQTIHVSQADR